MWAGMPDPCGNQEKLQDSDPVAGQVLAVAEQWKVKVSEWLDPKEKETDRVKEIIRRGQNGEFWLRAGEVASEANATGGEFKSALMAVAGAGPVVDPVRLGRWLRRYRDRPFGEYTFRTKEGRANANYFNLEVKPEWQVGAKQGRAKQPGAKPEVDDIEF